MSPIPYIKFYPADYLTDTAHLTTLEHGAYFLLLMNYWQRGKPLPVEENKLARIAGLSSDEWSSVGPTLLEFFEETDEGFSHKRVEKELSAVREKSQKARASATAKRTPSERSAKGQRKGTYTDTDTDKKKDSVAGATVAGGNTDAPDYDKMLFDEGKKIAKPSMVAKLKRVCSGDPVQALEIVRIAAGRSDPLAYLSAAVREQEKRHDKGKRHFAGIDEASRAASDYFDAIGVPRLD